jgi:hypothetical protein
MYVDQEMVSEALYQFQSGEIDLAELYEIVDWYDGDIAELL